jgi:hypothetical protein
LFGSRPSTDAPSSDRAQEGHLSLFVGLCESLETLTAASLSSLTSSQLPLCPLSPCSFDTQILSIPFHSAPGDEAFQNCALRTEFPNRLKTASLSVSRVRVEWDNCLSLQAVLAQKTLNRRRQPFDAVDLRLQRRQITSFILPRDLLDGCVIVSRIRSFQFERDYGATNLLVDESCSSLAVVGSGSIDDQYLLSPVSGRAFAGSCCASDQRARRQMVAGMISDITTMVFSVLKTSTLPLLPALSGFITSSSIFSAVPRRLSRPARRPADAAPASKDDSVRLIGQLERGAFMRTPKPTANKITRSRLQPIP